MRDVTPVASITFNRLIQGFMGLGLLVGVAALGVISARSVVERRQQIGVMRALGPRLRGRDDRDGRAGPRGRSGAPVRALRYE
jgi:hypothetical protein